MDKPKVSADNKTVRLIAGGDVMLGRQMPGWVALHGPSWPFAGIGSVLKTADLALVNLETCVSTLGDFLDKGGRQPYYYHTPPDMLDVLSEVGIQCVSTANNHAMDYGKEALVQQCGLLDASGFLHFGSGRDVMQAALPSYACINGLTIAFIGVETETPYMQAGIDSPGINYASTQDLLGSVAASIATARAHADIVIVTPHWGANWQEAPTPLLREVARGFIDLGADAVLGHSAHILQGLELHAGRPIVYDMGTLLFDRVSQNRMRDTALFELELGAQGVRQLTIYPVKLTEGQAHLAEGEDAIRIRELIIRLSHELNPTTQFKSLDEGLCVVCTPSSRANQNLKAKPPQKYLTQETHPKIPASYRHLRSNLVYDTLPVNCQWDTPVIVNSELEILGARFATPVRPGRGFVCEVYFRASAPTMPSRVEARLTALTSDREVAFVYTHPVAEGIHPPARWNPHEIICDRVVVRPATSLAEGSYDLYWHLRDMTNKISMRVEDTHERLVNGKVFLGKLVVSQSAPNGVAGIASRLQILRAEPVSSKIDWQDNPFHFWKTKARSWVVSVLTERGISPKPEAVRLVRNNPWGLVFCLMTNKGRIFFKAQSHANRHEPCLLETLSAKWPDLIPLPLGIQRESAWMITADYGHTLLDIHGQKMTPEIWRKLLPRLAEIQIESCQDVSRWLELGVPDRRLEKLPEQLAKLLNDEQAISLGEAAGLSREERDQALDLLPFFEKCCRKLAEQTFSAGLDQGDLHAGNILSRDSQFVFSDWGDASVSHPFCSLLLPYHTMGLQNESSLATLSWLAEAYLHPWCLSSRAPLETLIPSLHGALWAAHIIRALGWAQYPAQIETTVSVGSQTLVTKWIRLWLQRKTLLTNTLMCTETPKTAFSTSRPAKLATSTNPLLLDIDSIARITNGTWHCLPEEIMLTGVAHNWKYLMEGSQGNLYFPLNAEARDTSFTAKNVSSVINAFKGGAAAAVVPNSAKGLPDGLPLLHVENVKTALEALGTHVRDNLFTGKRVIVTGTEGKTGFKCMLHHVLSPQISTHAMLNSTNLDFSLYASLASIRQHDRIAILEAAGTHPGRCKRRSNIVKPHLFVITEVGNEHIMYHGSQQAIIEGKADIALGVCDGGYGILNADSRNYSAVRKAVLSRRRVPLLLFGSTPECNGRLIDRHFENNSWSVSAEIEGKKVEYKLPLLGEHAPLASVSVLLTAYYLGADVARAAAEFAEFVPYESQGVLRRITCHGGEALLFDNATRASVLSYQSALRTAARQAPPVSGGRKVAMIGQMIFLGDEAEQEHARLAEWIDEAGFDRIIFVGEHMEATYANLKNQAAVVKRFPSYDRRHSGKKELQQLINTLMEEIRPGDMVFVKGEVDEVGSYLRTLELKQPLIKPQPSHQIS
ncbi:MAG: CapA family protein [Gallionellaceae bacterium]|jgi:UDP-N-acetylmuramyl pentapeptide synthase/poly-gamma-glutamate capsule biosynthesis protein CapA/YwtB (metallophosphatase superfamily)